MFFFPPCINFNCLYYKEIDFSLRGKPVKFLQLKYVDAQFFSPSKSCSARKMSYFKMKILVRISMLLVVKGRPALNRLYRSNKIDRLVSQTQFFRSSGTGSRGLRSPHSKANMARGGSLSLGFLNVSFFFCKALRTSTGSVLPVNFCTPSSLNKDNKTETIMLI